MTELLRLGRPREPYWISLPLGVQVKVRPVTTAMWTAAQTRAQREVRALVEDLERRREAGVAMADLPDVEDEAVRIGLAQSMLARSLARDAIVEWQGVGDAEGNPVAVTPERAAELVDQEFAIAEAFLRQYLADDAAVSAEGNASAPAPGGTGAAGAATARSAGRAGSRAPKANAGRTGNGAPTSSTNRARSKAGPPGAP